MVSFWSKTEKGISKISVADAGCLSRIRIFPSLIVDPRSRGKKIPDLGSGPEFFSSWIQESKKHRVPDSGSGSATLAKVSFITSTVSGDYTKIISGSLTMLRCAMHTFYPEIPKI
jgi:hypothetical protein